MKKLLLVLVVVLVFALSGCGSNEQPEANLRVTQHDSGEITVCVFYEYADGTSESTCDLFVIDNSELEDRIAALEEQLNE